MSAMPSVTTWKPGAPFFVALSIRQPWLDLFLQGKKEPRRHRKHGLVQIEHRSWSTKHRGPIVLHASSGLANSLDIEAEGIDLARAKRLPRGCTYALGDLVAIEGDEGAYEFLIANVRRLVPMQVKGRIFTWACPANLVRLA